MRALVIAMALALPFAGCIGFGGGDENNTSDNETDDGGFFDRDDDNATGNGTGTWMYDNRTGTVQGVNLVVTSTGAMDETFTLENGTSSLVLNLTTTGGELRMCIMPPGADENDSDACKGDVTTSGGKGTYSTQDPEAGSWTVRLEPVAAGSVDYELSIGWLQGG